MPCEGYRQSDQSRDTLNEGPLPFAAPFMPESAVEAVVRCLRSGWIGTGPITAQFEQAFATYVGTQSAAAVSSCTAGLFLSLKALGVGKGDEVITTSMTFCSTVNAIIHTGATPVLVDIEPETKNLDVTALDAAVNERTRAVLPVHYAGYPADMTTISSFAASNDLIVVEDCAHAVETLWNGQHAGTFGDAGVFSFYATKNLAIGEGGMVVSDEARITSGVAKLALHGLSRDAWRRFSVSGKKTYDIETLGYKANMTDIQGAIGLAQLEVLESNYTRRREIWDYYASSLEGLGLELPRLPANVLSRHALHLFITGLPDRINRDLFVQRASDLDGVALGIHYKAVPDFAFYQGLLGIDPKDFPWATRWGRSCVSLGVSPRMTDRDVERVVDSVRRGLKCAW